MSLAPTVYVNVKSVPPEPLAKSTTASFPPVSNVNCGVPVTVTASANVTCILITSPVVNIPFAVDEVTFVIVGRTVSITNVGIVILPALPAVSVTVTVLLA